MTEETTQESVPRLPTRLERYRIPLGLLVLVLALRPVVSSDLLLGYNAIASKMLIMMLFVAGFNLLFGYTGLLSFGHAMFLGFGLYIPAIFVSNGPGLLPAGGGVTFLFGVALAVAGVAAYGYLLGRLIVGMGEIYFALLTLAFSQAIYFIVLRDPAGLTGGSNGLTQGTLPAFVEQTRGEIAIEAFGQSLDWYWAVALVFLVGMLALWQIVRSPFGRSLVAVSENEQLARAMGVNTTRYKIWSVTFSGIFSALAGVLLMIQSSGAAIENLSVFTSGDTVLMAVLGGVNYFFGPVVGAFSWLFVEDFLTGFELWQFPLSELTLVTVDLSDILVYWQFLLGALFVVVVLTAPEEGIWGYLSSVAEWLRTKLTEVIG
ncbi:amino acid/amide ABC transporter membrane protein 2, HAAT family [Halovenus aranensis]|uniref:Amino acid/amide ABC transporter membrane protein 2, HAAT family n=1 Tax=Halovenus aranensis TaxID=890420 RepID=A0A1G8SZT6_9EURY|nr:branched-chain amino acid ABC transporter permease [Halovenus aranensis]SDJ34802.1 amino acid/amide ABC transporter membrane protein 2, HAAT family [Halovenus aranensis]